MFYNRTSLFLLVLSLVTALCFMFNCSSPSPGEGTETNTETTGSDDDETTTTSLALKCALPKCSGSKCCNKGETAEKEECEDLCGGSRYLNLSGDGYRKCLTLERKFVKEKLLVLFDDVLSDPDEEGLIKKVDRKEIEIICSALKELDIDLLEDLIDDYSPYQAEAFLNYVGVQRLAIDIFKNTKEKEDGIELFKKLLEKVGGSSGTKEQKILNALKAVSTFEDDEEHILERALNRRNKEFVLFVHNSIVRDKEDGICSGDNKRYHPVPVSGHYRLANSLESAKKRSRYACILGVYCFIDSTTEGDRFRRSVANLFNNSGVQSLIKNPLTKGGLALTKSAPQNRWSEPACNNLNLYWNNGPSLDMGLGDSSTP